VRLLQVRLRLLLFMLLLLLLLLLLIQGHGVSVGQSRPLPLVNPHRSHGSFSAGQTGGERCERCHGAAAANKSMGALSRKAADLTAPTTTGATADVAPPTAAAAATTAIAASAAQQRRRLRVGEHEVHFRAAWAEQPHRVERLELSRRDAVPAQPQGSASPRPASQSQTCFMARKLKARTYGSRVPVRNRFAQHGRPVDYCHSRRRRKAATFTSRIVRRLTRRGRVGALEATWPVHVARERQASAHIASGSVEVSAAYDSLRGGDRETPQAARSHRQYPQLAKDCRLRLLYNLAPRGT
jgi:hypothetical protein